MFGAATLAGVRLKDIQHAIVKTLIDLAVWIAQLVEIFTELIVPFGDRQIAGLEHQRFSEHHVNIKCL